MKDRCLKILFAVMLLLGVLGIGHAVFAATTARTAMLLDVKGGIGPATQDFVVRGLQKAAASRASLVVLRIDTPGGLSKSMRGIIKAMLASKVPVIGYVAPSGARAASAGTYLLYASAIAAMSPGTNVGAATPVNLMGGSKDKTKQSKPSAMEKKIINDARAYIRSLAQLHGRNVAWAEKAVSHGASLSAVEALKLGVINVIATDVPNLLQQINGKTVVVQGKKQQLNTRGLILTIHQPDWRTRFLSVITDPSVAYILIMIGLYGLFLEFTNPGLIVPGVVGALSLLIASYALQLLPVNYAGLALIMLGIIFIIAEIMMPSIGALGIGGVVGVIVGSVLMLRIDAPGFGIPWYLIASVSVVSVAFFVGVLQLAVRARRRPVVSGTEGMIGEEGVLKENKGTLWLPVHGEVWQVSSEQPLKAGQRVRVAAVSGLCLQVEPVVSQQGE